jgi:hypothetical protein
MLCMHGQFLSDVNGPHWVLKLVGGVVWLLSEDDVARDRQLSSMARVLRYKTHYLW